MLTSFARRRASSLYNKVDETCRAYKARLNIIKKNHASTVLGESTVGSVIGGMRGVKGLLTQTSELDPMDGIKFRGWSIPQIEAEFPKRHEQPIPEGITWLLMTGEKPTVANCQEISDDLYERATKIPPNCERVLRALPKETHPMTMLSIGIMALQEQSQFLKAYQKGVRKDDYWKSTYEDAMNIIAQCTTVAALIYRIKYFDGKLPSMDPALDWGANYAKMMGNDDPMFYDYMRLFQTLHCDHEGGNVSAHTVHLVGSTLADPYLSYAAGINGLAGPLHGAANAEVLSMILKLQKEYGDKPTREECKTFIQDQLSAGQVIPGYGHAVLKRTDPRFVSQHGFAQKYLTDDPLCRMVDILYDEVPKILEATGKVSNPWPNVDAHSGALLTYFGVNQFEYFTVLFAVSRAIGTMSHMVMARYLNLPLERPKSVTFERLEEAISKAS